MYKKNITVLENPNLPNEKFIDRISSIISVKKIFQLFHTKSDSLQILSVI